MTKDQDGYIEKPRTYRDRSKPRREDAPAERVPRHTPYHRTKDWMQLPYEQGYGDDDDEET